MRPTFNLDASRLQHSQHELARLRPLVAWQVAHVYGDL
jgi:hypothetical protein